MEMNIEMDKSQFLQVTRNEYNRVMRGSASLWKTASSEESAAYIMIEVETIGVVKFS